MFRIVRHEALTPNTFLWEVEAPDVAAAAQPGQFVMVRLHDGAERIPLTIADFDASRGTVTIVVQSLGRSTAEMRDKYHEGDTFADFVGPLGTPTEIPTVAPGESSHVVLVGGGLGVAPVFPQLRAFRQAGHRTTCIVGFRSVELGFWQPRLEEWADELIVCTDDGSSGRAGLVTEALADVVAADRPDLVVAIGPMVMMRACAEVTRPTGVHTVASLNTIMVDGTGMCGSCRVSVDGVTRFACVDGPDFDAHAVDFDELLQRNRRFATEEESAVTDYQHRCQVEQTLFVDGKRTYKKLREIEPTKVPMPVRDAEVRSHTFDEVSLGYSLSEALREAERCIQCSRPTCISGCPVAIDIPRFIRHLLVKDVDGALGIIREASILPSVCGRVCPQETQCESQCVIARKMEPVAIGRLERFVGDHGKVAPATIAPSRGKRAAVVGSGPAGLACAADLARAGVDVTILEALHVTGGVLRYGIPSFRLPREIIDREIAGLLDMGVTIETDKVVGRTFTVNDLLTTRGFDTVFLGVGAGAPSFLGIPGENAGRVISANEFLTRVNLMGGDRFPDIDTPVGIGTNVVVVGAGNTAMDCLRVARRLGAEVRCVYRRSRAGARPLGGTAPRRGRGRAVHVPAQPGGGAHRRRRLGARPACRADGTRRARRVGPPPPDAHGGDLRRRLRHGDRRAGYQPEPDRHPQHRRSRARPARLCRRGPRHPGDQPAGRVRRRRHRHGWRHRDPRDGCRPTRRSGDARLPRWSQRGRAGAAHGRTHLSALCHRPMDDDDEGVCCAGAVVAWRCTECAKRSEGFAFPYGRCPACGGTLESTDLAEPQDSAMEAVRHAFEIELGGRDFYIAAADATDNDEMRDMFSRLAAMEREHIDTLVQRYHMPPPPDAHGSLHPGMLQAGGRTTFDDPLALVEMAITLEQRAEQFFLDRIELAAPAARELYCELAAEEREHVDLLVTELAALREHRHGLL